MNNHWWIYFPRSCWFEELKMMNCNEAEGSSENKELTLLRHCDRFWATSPNFNQWSLIILRTPIKCVPSTNMDYSSVNYFIDKFYILFLPLIVYFQPTVNETIIKGWDKWWAGKGTHIRASSVKWDSQLHQPISGMSAILYSQPLYCSLQFFLFARTGSRIV